MNIKLLSKKTLSKFSIGTICGLLVLPLITFAALGDGQLEAFGGRIITFINGVLTPFVFAVALLLFVYGAFLYFIYDSEEDEKRKKGKEYMLWAFIALVIMVSVWGITNLIASGLGFDDPDAIDGLIPNAAEFRGGAGGG